MSFPDFLYRPSAYDEAKATVLPSRLLTNDTSTGTTVSVFVQSLPIPPDQVMVVAGFHVFASVVGGEFINQIVARITDTSFNEIALVASRLAPAASVEFAFYQEMGDVVLLGGERFRAQCIFNAGVQAKTTRLTLCGVMYPRGNWQQGAV